MISKSECHGVKISCMEKLAALTTRMIDAIVILPLRLKPKENLNNIAKNIKKTSNPTKYVSKFAPLFYIFYKICRSK